MAEKDTIFSTKLKQTGVFDFKELYKFIFDWLSDEGYYVAEKKYSEAIKPGGKELDIEWEAKKKVSDYFRFTIKVTWFIAGMNDVEVEKNGVKVKMNKAAIELKAKGILEKDYESRWENSPFIKFLRGVYDKYIIKGRVDDYETKLISDVDELIAQVKSYLSLEAKK